MNQKPPTCKIQTNARRTSVCSFRPLGSHVVCWGCNKGMVPLCKGPPCSHTKNMAQESIPVLTGNFMCMVGAVREEWDKNNSENLKARSSFTDHSVLLPKFYRWRKLGGEVNVSFPIKHYIVDPSQILTEQTVLPA